jgi:uncharacterized membrane protein
VDNIHENCAVDFDVIFRWEIIVNVIFVFIGPLSTVQIIGMQWFFFVLHQM